MKLPKWTIIAVGLLTMGLLGACSPGYGSPESASESFFNAYESQEKDRIEEAVCDQFIDRIPDFELPDDNKLEYDFNVRFHTDEENSERAEVNAYGTIRIRLITEEGDVEYKLHSKGDNPLFTIQVDKDGDDWKVCDEDFISGARFSPFG